MTDDNIINLHAKMIERARHGDDVERMDLKLKMAGVAVEAVKKMLKLGATYEEIARPLQVVVDDLRSTSHGSFR